MPQPRKPFTRIEARARAARRDASSRVVVSLPATAESTDDEDAATPTARSAELWLYGTVGGYWWGFDSDDVAEALRAMGDVTDITVRLHSFGGSAIEGIAIANLLANHPARVQVVVDGIAASAATQVALAGDELIMSPGSQFMVHDASTYIFGNAADLRAAADWIDKQSTNYAETYAHRAGGTAAEWRVRMIGPDGEDGTWYTAAETVEAGLADRVANIPSTQPPPPMPDPEDIFDDEDGDLAAARVFDLEMLLTPAARAAWSTWRSRATQSPERSPRAGNTEQEGSDMSFINDVRTRLGAAEDADEATVLAALDEALEERAEPATAATTTPVVPAGMTLISTDVLGTLQTQARDGAEARAQQRTEARDQAINAAVTEGRISPAQREHFTALYDADPTGTRALLTQLAPGLVPVAEMGHDQDVDADAAFEAAHAATLASQGIPTTAKEA